MKSNSDVIKIDQYFGNVISLKCEACDELLDIPQSDDVARDLNGIPMAVIIELIRVHVIPTINPKHEEKMLDLNRDLELQEILDGENDGTR